MDHSIEKALRVDNDHAAAIGRGVGRSDRFRDRFLATHQFSVCR